jgi:hypothetical protein
MRRGVTIIVVVAAIVSLAGGAYRQWWHGPSFAEQFAAVRGADFFDYAVRAPLERIDADTVEAAVESGRGTARATFRGRWAGDVMTMDVYADSARAREEFAARKAASDRLVDLLPGTFYPSGYCAHIQAIYRCAVLWDDALIAEGQAAAGLDEAQHFVQSGVKGWINVKLELAKGSHPFVLAVLASVLLLLLLGAGLAITAPGPARGPDYDGWPSRTGEKDGRGS